MYFYKDFKFCCYFLCLNNGLKKLFSSFYYNKPRPKQAARAKTCGISDQLKTAQVDYNETEKNQFLVQKSRHVQLA